MHRDQTRAGEPTRADALMRYAADHRGLPATRTELIELAFELSSADPDAEHPAWLTEALRLALTPERPAPILTPVAPPAEPVWHQLDLFEAAAEGVA